MNALYEDRLKLAEEISQVLKIPVRIASLPIIRPPEGLIIEAEPFIDRHQHRSYGAYLTNWTLKLVSQSSADEEERVKYLDGLINKIQLSNIWKFVNSVSSYQAATAPDSQPYLTCSISLTIPIEQE